MVDLKNRAGVTSTTTGTGTITLGSALTSASVVNSVSWQTFANAGVTDGEIVRYLILDSNGAWEYGPTVYTASGTTITRPAGLMDGSVSGQKSSTGSLLNLSGNEQVFIAAIAEDIFTPNNPTSGFLVNKNGSNQNVSTAAVTALTWSTESFDINNEFASNTFTPVNAGYYLFECSAHVTAVGVGTTAVKLHLYKNGSLSQTFEVAPASLADVTLGGSVIINAAASDAFDTRIEFVGYTSGTATVAGAVTESWFTGVRLSISGNVSGPSSSTDNAVARYDGTTGQVIQNSSFNLGDDGACLTNGTGCGYLSYDRSGVPNGFFTFYRNGGFIILDDTSNVFLTEDGSTRFVGIGNGFFGPERSLHVKYDSATTNAVIPVLRLQATSSGTPAAGIGVGQEFEVETAAGNNEIGATIEAIATDVTSSSEDFDVVIKTMAAGAAAAERFRIGSIKVVPAVAFVENVSILTDGATPALDASLGNIFTLSAAGDRTIAVPSNATSGQKIIIEHTASSGARTLSLNTGAGGFRFGTDITALTQTASGKTDYIGCIYNSSSSTWDVVAYTKGF